MRMGAYKWLMVASLAESPRWELYRLLGEPRRLRLLGLTSEDELSIGELAELTGEAQPNVSKHLKQLREAGLVSASRGSKLWPCAWSGTGKRLSSSSVGIRSRFCTV